LALLTVLSLALSACGSSAAGSPVRKSNLRRENPNIQASDLHNLTDGNNAFAFDLYQSLRSENGNLAYSPFSISLALAMTSAGARGETEAQMTQAMHFLQLNVANAVWTEQTLPLQSDFLDTLALHYGAGIHQSDFINQPNAVKDEINSWVSDETQEKIKDLLSENAIGPFTRMVLVNAIYFKADWLNQFDSNSTADAPFHLLDGSQVQAPLMNKGMTLPYAAGDGWQMAELPYAGGTAAMDILVPDEGRFEEIEASLNAEAVSAMWSGLQPTSVAFALPKFKVESSFKLDDSLAALGMPNAFDPDLADFSGITGHNDLFIGAVVHKAFVAVDEEGTEAAAATAVIMELSMAPMFDVTLTVDRPFLYIIRDLQSGQILFMGRVLNPAQ
jgi:serpin B